MLKFRFALFAAAAAVVLGTASAMAMQEGASGADPRSHGDIVSSAARTTCPRGANGVHGQCVSAIASANGQAHANSVATCKATERAARGSKPDKATKTAAHQAFKACVATKTAGTTGTDATDTAEAADTADATDTADSTDEAEATEPTESSEAS